jgi:hypothetical protein
MYHLEYHWKLKSASSLNFVESGFAYFAATVVILSYKTLDALSTSVLTKLNSERTDCRCSGLLMEESNNSLVSLDNTSICLSNLAKREEVVEILSKS